jgi:glycosyltransferase involved in cell wall biosynthesis
MSTITAVIPCFNAEAHIAAAIESVLGQSRPADEILVIDDCSTDHTAAVAGDYPVTLLRNSVNQGAGAARNLAITAATTDLIACLDADDRWLPNHLEVVAGLLDRFDAAAVAFSPVRHEGSRSGVWQPRHFIPAGEPVDAFWACLMNNIVPQMSAVVRRAALLEVGGYDASMRRSQDYDLWLRLSREHRFVRSAEVTASYVAHPEQMSVKYRGDQVIADHQSRARLLRNIREEGDEALAAAVAARMRELWIESLRIAWGFGDKRGLGHLVNAAGMVPIGIVERLGWTARARAYLAAFAVWGLLKRAVAR